MLFIGIVLGFVIGIVLIFVLEILGPRVKNQAYLTDNYEVPLLGRIPQVKASVKAERNAQGQPFQSSTSEKEAAEKDYAKKMIRGAK